MRSYTRALFEFALHGHFKFNRPQLVAVKMGCKRSNLSPVSHHSQPENSMQFKSRRTRREKRQNVNCFEIDMTFMESEFTRVSSRVSGNLQV